MSSSSGTSKSESSLLTNDQRSVLRRRAFINYGGNIENIAEVLGPECFPRLQAPTREQKIASLQRFKRDQLCWIKVKKIGCRDKTKKKEGAQTKKRKKAAQAKTGPTKCEAKVIISARGKKLQIKTTAFHGECGPILKVLVRLQETESFQILIPDNPDTPLWVLNFGGSKAAVKDIRRAVATLLTAADPDLRQRKRNRVGKARKFANFWGGTSELHSEVLRVGYRKLEETLNEDLVFALLTMVHKGAGKKVVLLGTSGACI